MTTTTTIVLSIIIGILTLLTILLIYICINLYKKLLKHESYIINLDKSLLQILTRLKTLDDKEMFEKDDEIGILWEEIKKTILQIEAYLIK